MTHGISGKTLDVELTNSHWLALEGGVRLGRKELAETIRKLILQELGLVSESETPLCSKILRHCEYEVGLRT